MGVGAIHCRVSRRIVTPDLAADLAEAQERALELLRLLVRGRRKGKGPMRASRYAPSMLQRRTPAVDVLLFATVFTITFAKVRWVVAGADVNVSDVFAALFVAAFLLSRLERRDFSFPRTSAVLTAFFGAFSVVYLLGFFNLTDVDDLVQFAKGMAKFAIHFAFLVAAVAHLAERSHEFYWRTLAWFTGGIAANALYGLFELGYAEATGSDLDQLVLAPVTGEVRGGINVFGAVGGQEVFRTNALMLDPNHLGIVLVIPLLVLLPLYLRLERGHRMRAPLAFLLGFLLLVELATLSRSGLLGLAAGLAVLALAYRHLFLSARVLVPLGAVAAAVGVVVAQRVDFFETVLRARTSLSGGGSRVHLELYELIPPVLSAHPFFGLGLNTFSTYYEAVTGETNWGPHSYYVAVLTESGLAGTALFAVYVLYLFRRLGVLRELGRSLAAAGRAAAARVRPLSWGLTAALVGTMAANLFYLTMQMYYFFVFAVLVLAAPAVFSRESRRPHDLVPEAR